MKAIVLAGGHSDSLGPLSFDAPTVSLPVAGKPLLVRVLEQLEGQGITGVVVSCYRHPHLVEKAVAECSVTIPVATALEIPPYGSANVVAQLASRLKETFLVVAGDVVTDLRVDAALEMHARTGSVATVLVCDSVPPCPFGEVETDRQGAVVMAGSEQLVLRDGPRKAISGIYLLEPAVLKYIPADRRFDLARDLLPLLVEQELPVYASHQQGYWQAVTTVEHYRVANLDVLSGRVSGLSPTGEQITPGVWAEDGADVAPGATLKPPLLLGAGCRVERDATLGPETVLAAGILVKRGARVSRSVVLSGSKVGLATRLDEAVVRGNVLARASTPHPTYVDDRQVLETLEPLDLRAVVRSFADRAIALMALIALSPLLLLIALAIKTDSRGPILYSQLRVGQGRRTTSGQYQGRVFELLKFRTMYEDADRRLKEVLEQNEYGSAPFVKIKNDPRITRIGSFLRATSLDELPQFINVVRGDMGLVGNRPLPLYEAEGLSDEWQRIRFSAPAGITGLWQISGRSDLSAEERMVLDNYYALTHSFWSDMKILLVTIPSLLARRGAR